jgi:carbonic anhydrase/acetyltransferase-like protein (isoleucine patch superfamily)
MTGGVSRAAETSWVAPGAYVLGQVALRARSSVWPDLRSW